MAKHTQSNRLTNQHKESLGGVGIFGDNSKLHDVRSVKSHIVY